MCDTRGTFVDVCLDVCVCVCDYLERRLFVQVYDLLLDIPVLRVLTENLPLVSIHYGRFSSLIGLARILLLLSEYTFLACSSIYVSGHKGLCSNRIKHILYELQCEIYRCSY